MVEFDNYDALSPVVDFNVKAGFEVERREVEDQEVQTQMYAIYQEEVDELLEAFESNDRTGVVDGAGDVIVTAAGLLAKMGINPNEVMRRINESNASKFCKDAVEAHESVVSYRDNKEYVDVHAKLVGDVYVIFGRKVGTGSFKILKGINYHKPKLDDL